MQRRVMKELVRRAAKEKIKYHGEQPTVNRHFEKGMKGTQAHMVSKPQDQQPARPIGAAQHKHATNYRQEADKANPDQSICD